MTYKNMIPGCFGDQDKIFGSHGHYEVKRVRAMIHKAQEEGEAEGDVAKEIEDYLNNIGSSKIHIDEQINRFHTAWYWIAD
jgi:trehalose-6-phosphatase